MRISRFYVPLWAALGIAICTGASGVVAQTTTSAPVPPVTSLQGEPDRLWTQVRDYTFEQRTEFIDAVQRLELQLDEAIAGLKAKRATFPGDLAVWDREMKRLDEFHTYLKSVSSELTEATGVNWEYRKQRFSVAWERMKAAYERATDLTAP